MSMRKSSRRVMKIKAHRVARDEWYHIDNLLTPHIIQQQGRNQASITKWLGVYSDGIEGKSITNLITLTTYSSISNYNHGKS